MDSLPTEILRSIFLCLVPLDPYEDWWEHRLLNPPTEVSPSKNLLLLSRVCRRFHLVARQLLFHTFHFNYLGVPDCARYFSALKKALLADPSQGAYTQSLYFRGEPITRPRSPNRGFLDESELRCIEELQLPDSHPSRKILRWRKKWQGVGKRYPFPFSWDGKSLVLMWMPNLQKIDCAISAGDNWLFPFLSGRRELEEMLIKHLFREDVNLIPLAQEEVDELFSNQPLAVNTMPKLKEVRLIQDQDPGWHQSTFILESLLLHPGLERVRLQHFRWIKWDIEEMDYGHLPSNIRFLQLRECLVDQHGFKHILNWCPHLQHLTVEFPDSKMRDLFDKQRLAEMSLLGIGEALNESGTNLTYLDLDTFLLSENNVIPGVLRDLSKLTQLRHLRICREDLSDWKSCYSEDELERDENKFREYPTLEKCLPLNIETVYFRPKEANPEREVGLRRDRGLVEEIVLLLNGNMLPMLHRVSIELSGVSNSEVEVGEVQGWKISNLEEYIAKEGIHKDPRTILVYSRVTKNQP